MYFASKILSQSVFFSYFRWRALAVCMNALLWKWRTRSLIGWWSPLCLWV